MNLFVLDENPRRAAHMVCDKHAGKMAVEGMQCLVSALLISDAPPEKMPLTSNGEPHRGGYHNHPIVRWAAECFANFHWLYKHTQALCYTYKLRYGKKHAVEEQLEHLIRAFAWGDYIPHIGYTDKGEGIRTPFVRCLNQSQGRNLDLLNEDEYSAVEAYREFYFREKRRFAKWEKGICAPDWWGQKEWDLNEREEV